MIPTCRRLLWIGQRSILGTLGLTLLAACAPDSSSSQTPAPAASSESRTEQRWRIEHYKVPCAGEGPRLCYLVDRGQGELESFYDEIEGFEYLWGYSYEIAVTSSDQPATADGSTLRHRLVAVLGQQPAPSDAVFSLPLTLDGQVLVEVRDGRCTLLGAIEIDADAQGCEQLRSLKFAIFGHDATRQKLVPGLEAFMQILPSP